jgi:CheY-like chemotaxis protein
MRSRRRMRPNGKEKTQKYSGRVLVADDDAQFRDLLVRCARKMGLSVLEVEDGMRRWKPWKVNVST